MRTVRGSMILRYVFTCAILGNLARGHLLIKQPSFRNTPTTIKSKENDTAFVPCILDHLGGNRLRWWKGDTLLFDSDETQVRIPPRVSVMPDGVTIDAVTPEDAGNYTCEVVRPEPWSPLKLIQTLQVLYPPALFPNPPNGYLEVVLGEKVAIGCSATGEPQPTILWRTRDVPMDSFGKNAEKVEFTASSRHLSGIYQCEARNGIGDPVHANIILRILHPPEVEVEKERVHSAPGVKMALKCRVVAEPQSKVSWLLDGEPIKTSGSRLVQQTRDQENLLLLNPVAASDFGNYTCRAINRLGTGERTIELTGVANSGVFKAAEIRPPNGFVLVWEVDSFSPVFNYKLFFRKEGALHWNSVIIPSDGSSSGPLHSKSYFLSGLDRSTYYEAKVSSRNRFGWSEPSQIIKFAFTRPGFTTGNGGPEGPLANESGNVSGSAERKSSRPLILLLIVFISCPCIYGTC